MGRRVRVTIWTLLVRSFSDTDVEDGALYSTVQYSIDTLDVIARADNVRQMARGSYDSFNLHLHPLATRWHA